MDLKQKLKYKYKSLLPHPQDSSGSALRDYRLSADLKLNARPKPIWVKFGPGAEATTNSYSVMSKNFKLLFADRQTFKFVLLSHPPTLAPSELF